MFYDDFDTGYGGYSGGGESDFQREDAEYGSGFGGGGSGEFSGTPEERYNAAVKAYDANLRTMTGDEQRRFARNNPPPSPEDFGITQEELYKDAADDIVSLDDDEGLLPNVPRAEVMPDGSLGWGQFDGYDPVTGEVQYRDVEPAEPGAVESFFRRFFGTVPGLAGALFGPIGVYGAMAGGIGASNWFNTHRGPDMTGWTQEEIDYYNDNLAYDGDGGAPTGTHGPGGSGGLISDPGEYGSGDYGDVYHPPDSGSVFTNEYDGDSGDGNSSENDDPIGDLTDPEVDFFDPDPTPAPTPVPNVLTPFAGMGTYDTIHAMNPGLNPNYNPAPHPQQGAAEAMVQSILNDMYGGQN